MVMTHTHTYWVMQYFMVLPTQNCWLLAPVTDMFVLWKQSTQKPLLIKTFVGLSNCKFKGFVRMTHICALLYSCECWLRQVTLYIQIRSPMPIAVMGVQFLPPYVCFSAWYTNNFSTAADRPTRHRGSSHAKYSILHHMVIKPFLHSA